LGNGAAAYATVETVPPKGADPLEEFRGLDREVLRY
jgi:hypothetical protein